MKKTERRAAKCETPEDTQILKLETHTATRYIALSSSSYPMRKKQRKTREKNVERRKEKRKLEKLQHEQINQQDTMRGVKASATVSAAHDNMMGVKENLGLVP